MCFYEGRAVFRGRIAKAQFDADAAHLKSKASHAKITPALASEMKKDVNKIYNHALGQ